jgi:serine/threonine-protein kinase
MNPERWRRIDIVYHAALAHPVEQRPAFLADACDGDEALRREVETLLAAPPTADGVFAARAVDIARRLVSDSSASVLTGGRLGVYRLEERIGAGGMDI